MKPATPGITPIPEQSLDTRSDEEIIASLKSPQPVRHERNVWAFWNTGLDNMKPWCRRNVLGWVRRQGPSWDVRVLDMVPGSDAHIHKFVSPDQLPEAFNKNTLDGPTAGQHASDCVRLPLLFQYGGVWLDVGSIMFRTFDDIFWRDIENPDSPFEMGITLFQSRKFPGQLITGFVGAKKGNPFIERWMKVWKEMWADGRTNCRGLHQHPLVKHLGLIVPPEAQHNPNKRKLDMGGKGFDLAFLTDYLAFNMAYERVRLLVDEAEGWNGPEYFQKHVHKTDAVDEIWKTHEMLQLDEAFPLLALPYKPENVDKDKDQKAAADYVGHLLANCSLAKHSSGYYQPGMRIPLAMSWSLPENAEADIKPGTWSEYMRLASVSCEQMRRKGTCLESLQLPPEQGEILHAGLLEAKE